MKNIRFSSFIEALIFGFVLMSDRILKQWSENLTEPLLIGPFHFETIYNYGVMGGNFSHLPVIMKTVTLTSIASFIFCFYLFSRFFFPMKSLWLKCGIVFMIAGILGNVCDRILGNNGAVIDFISFTWNSYHSPVWNPADVYQVAGVFMIIFGLWRDSKNFWYQDDQRKIQWIMPAFQIKLSLAIACLGLMCGVVTSVMSYAFLKVVLQDDDHLNTFLISATVTQLSLTLVLFMCASFVTGKIAGPLFAILRFLHTTLERNQTPFKLRKHDDLKEFEAPLNAINERLHEEEKKKEAA